jgi:hypothetical protein
LLDNKKKFYRNECGQSIVEFGLILPLFLLILFFIVDFGWLAYQNASFEYGYMQASWTVSADDLGDMDELENVPSEKIYSGALVADTIRSDLNNSSIGISSDNLEVIDAKAVLYNEEEYFNVAGRVPGEKIKAVSRTRYMKLSAVLRYHAQPITYVGKIFFGDRVSFEKDLSRIRVVRTQTRTE